MNIGLVNIVIAFYQSLVNIALFVIFGKQISSAFKFMIRIVTEKPLSFWGGDNQSMYVPQVPHSHILMTSAWGPSYFLGLKFWPK